MRSAHWLKQNRSCETIHELIIVDTETKSRLEKSGDEVLTLWFGWACRVRRLSSGDWTRPQWHRFTTPAELWAKVEQWQHGRSRCYVFAHNWGFDALTTGMFTELPKRKWKMDSACLDAPPLIIRWRKGAQTLQILDSLNYWRVSLASLEPAAGLPKLRMPKPNASKARWDAYCRRDCRVVLRMVTRWADFLVSNDLGGFAPTLASQSMRTFRHRFMEHKILIDDNESALSLARAAYVGGRTECLQLGTIPGKTFALDVTSMYPSVMRDNYFPARLVTVQRLCTPLDLKTLMRKYSVVADVEIEIDRPAVPLRRKDKLIFPIGRFRGTWSTPELMLIAELGKIHRVFHVAVYDREKLFKPFIEFMWSQRLHWIKQGVAAFAFFFKILMNSFYGKWGQRGIRWEDTQHYRGQEVKAWDEFDADLKQWVRYRRIGGLEQRQTDAGESRDSHPAIAAHVTAYARVALFRFAVKAGWENVFYFDTDALWCNRKGYKRLRQYVKKHTLGALGLVWSKRDIVIHGLKDYHLGDEVKIKGIRKDAIQVGKGAYAQAQWQGLRGAIRSGDVSRPRIRGIVKRLKRIYSKGERLPSGRVSPFTLP